MESTAGSISEALCDKNVLRSLPLGTGALIIADCEGYEVELFDDETCAASYPGTA